MSKKVMLLGWVLYLMSDDEFYFIVFSRAPHSFPAEELHVGDGAE